jgi:hypothetical protein
MVDRWSSSEQIALQQMRTNLTDLNAFDLVPPYQDIVGDRRLLRFIRGKNGDVDEATKQYHEFLKWYVAEGMLTVRNEILYQGCDSPLSFPKGKEFITLAPQVVLAPRHTDNLGRPIMFEAFGVDPASIFSVLTIDDYILFLKYCLEYRNLVLEQLSAEAEAKASNDAAERSTGVILNLCIIRDLNGIGWSHLSSDAKAMIKAGLDVAVPNYPDTLGVSHMVNAPYIFHGLWMFIRNLLDANIINKISISSANGLDALSKDLPTTSIPDCVGGQLCMDGQNGAFEFDYSMGLFDLVDPINPNEHNQSQLKDDNPHPAPTAADENQELRDCCNGLSAAETNDRTRRSHDSAKEGRGTPDILPPDILATCPMSVLRTSTENLTDCLGTELSLDALTIPHKAGSGDAIFIRPDGKTNKVRLVKIKQIDDHGEYIFGLSRPKHLNENESDTPPLSGNDLSSSCDSSSPESLSTSAPDSEHPRTLHISTSTSKLKLKIKKELIFYETASYSPDRGNRNDCFQSANITRSSCPPIAASEPRTMLGSSSLVIFGVDILELLPAWALYVVLALILLDVFVVKGISSLSGVVMRLVGILLLGSLLVMHTMRQITTKRHGVDPDEN